MILQSGVISCVSKDSCSKYMLREFILFSFQKEKVSTVLFNERIKKIPQETIISHQLDWTNVWGNKMSGVVLL